MRIREVTLKNVRAFGEATFTLPHAAPGWYVILGDNGTGKSTLVRAIALALTGPLDAIGLRQKWSDWLRHGADRLSIAIDIAFDADLDTWTGSGKRPKASFEVEFTYRAGEQHPEQATDGKGKRGLRTVWGDGAGWFSAAFGPFRRFTGGSREQDRIYLSIPRLARHLTAFGEDVALTECLDWLVKLAGSKDAADVAFAAHLTTLVNDSGFLPHAVRFDGVEAETPIFVDAAGVRLPVDQLSDGYRSTLSMAFELIRQLRQVYPEQPIFTEGDGGAPPTVELPGVVLIDEADVHLHPSWQAGIGAWFKRFFPRMQFIVTTHSPLICRPADGVWRLAALDGAIEARPIEGAALDRLRYGTIDEALDSPGFDLGEISRSAEANALLDELTELNLRARRRDLTRAEAQRRARLRQIFPTDG